MDSSEGESELLSHLQGVSPARSAHPQLVFVGAAALLKSKERKINKLLLSGVRSLLLRSSSRLRASSQARLDLDDRGGKAVSLDKQAPLKSVGNLLRVRLLLSYTPLTNSCMCQVQSYGGTRKQSINNPTGRGHRL